MGRKTLSIRRAKSWLRIAAAMRRALAGMSFIAVMPAPRVERTRLPV